jgi:hypothetical protein
LSCSSRGSAVRVAHLTEQDRAPVAELRHEVAELMSRVGRRNRRRARRQRIAGKQRRQVLIIEARQAEPEFCGQRPIDLDQTRLFDRYGILARKEMLGQSRIAAHEINARDRLSQGR